MFVPANGVYFCSRLVLIRMKGEVAIRESVCAGAFAPRIPGFPSRRSWEASVNNVWEVFSDLLHCYLSPTVEGGT